MTDKVEKTVNEETEKRLRTVTGKVVSSKMDKTVTVLVERLVKHPMYGKYLRRSTKFKAHDEENTCNEGDVVMIAECRPISKNKSWRLVEVVERGNA
jgi:small subunit ribosomal protein S17